MVVSRCRASNQGGANPSHTLHEKYQARLGAVVEVDMMEQTSLSGE